MRDHAGRRSASASSCFLAGRASEAALRALADASEEDGSWLVGTSRAASALTNLEAFFSRLMINFRMRSLSMGVIFAN